jgi:alpha-1,3-rhamnosyl/mannosyltransferase
MVDSEFTGREAVRLLNIDPALIRRVYLSTPDFQESPQHFHESFPAVGNDYLICVGTVEPRKNLESLLDAWRILREELSGYSLVVAGRWGWGHRSLRRRLRAEPDVIWTGMISGKLLRSAVCGARLLVYPSLYEGFGLPPLEAASAGVPSVLGPAEALIEIYGELAASYCGSSPGSITDAVLSALVSHPDPETLREFALQMSNGAMAGRILEVYAEVMS